MASNKLICTLIIFTILFVGPISATSRGFTTMHPEEHRGRKNDVDTNPGLLVAMLPKGKRVPPSGPSKRHNSVVNSTPPN